MTASNKSPAPAGYVVIVQPGCAPHVAHLAPTLGNLQALVGGLIENVGRAVFGTPPNYSTGTTGVQLVDGPNGQKGLACDVWGNEEAKLLGLPGSLHWGEDGEKMSGPLVFCCSTPDGNTRGIPDVVMADYIERCVGGEWPSCFERVEWEMEGPIVFSSSEEMVAFLKRKAAEQKAAGAAAKAAADLDALKGPAPGAGERRPNLN